MAAFALLAPEHLYVPTTESATHVSLRSGGRVRFIAPRALSAAQAGISFFLRGRNRLKACALWWWASAQRGTRARESDAISFLRRQCLPAVDATFLKKGADGPWSKDSILLLEDGTRPVGIAKVGRADKVRDLVMNEAQWLARLGAKQSLHPHLPAVLATGEVARSVRLEDTI